ncbi:MAG: hypothetical protein QG580_212 [Patescibacteria group bacterium]|nr:hypothetical protein [Patescibacteria group bacterium]
MCMNLFKTSKKQEEVVAFFDIGSGSVGGSIILASNKSAPTVLSSIRQNLKIKEDLKGETALKEMLSALKEVANYIQKDSKMVPDKVYAILSSPWSFASLKNIKRTSTTNFKVTEKFVNDLIQDEIENKKKTNSALDVLIDKRLVDIKVNGYEIENPFGKQVRELSINLFISMSSTYIINAIEDTIMSTYHKNIKFTSQMFSDFMVVRDIFDNLNDFIILNIDEEFTEVSIMQNDNLIHSSSFPYGKNTLIRKIAKNIGKNTIEAKSLIFAYYNSHLTDKQVNSLSSAIKSANMEWINSLKRIFTGVLTDMVLPEYIFMVTDDSSKEWFANLTSMGNFSEFTTTKNDFNVIIGDSKILKDFCSFALNVLPDDNLTMQAIFINKINFL